MALIPTREELATGFLGDYAIAQPEKNIARGSDPYRLARVVSGAIWNVLAKLLFVEKQRLPDTAEKEYLERWGGVYSFPRNGATSAGRTNALRVFGTAGTPVPVDSALAHKDGTTYKVTSVGAVVGGAGYVDVSVIATVTGQATNKNAGEVLTLQTPGALTADATLVLALTGGLDIESYDAYRVRLLAHIGDPPEGGAIHDYLEWALRIPGVVTAYVWTHRRGMGTVDVAVLGLGTGAARIVSNDIQGAVDTYIESVRPGGARDFVTLTVTPQAQDVTCTVVVDDTNYGWDWDDLGVGYSISASDSMASTITVPGILASVVGGVRIQVLGEEARVTGRLGDVLTLAFDNDYDGNAVSWFTFAVSTQSVRASGDVVRPARNAILALFNTLGPARSGAAPSTYARTSWLSDLKLSKLFGAITDTPGIDDATITNPLANVYPRDPYDTTVPLLVPGVIRVLKP